MIIVHHLNNSRSQRILWLLEELGLPYEIKMYQRQPNLLAPPELKAIHPLGKSPVITDGDRTIAETGAIIEYIISNYAGARLIPPPFIDARYAYTYFLHYAEGTAMTPLLMKLVAANIPKRAPFLVRPIASGIGKALEKTLVTPNLKANFDFWETTLSQSAWFAGSEFTAADIMMSFPVETGCARADAGTRPHVAAWLKTIHARPAYQKALERGGPYAYA